MPQLLRELIYPPVPREPLAEVSVGRTTNLPTLFTVTASATPHTKGPWTELIASTSADVTMLRIYATGSQTSTTITSQLLDIGVGAAASEVVVIPDLTVGFQYSIINGRNPSFDIPVRIPAGSRISARIQAAVISDTLSVGVDAFNKQLGYQYYTSSALLSYGVTAATSLGTNVVAGLSGAEGTWTTITAGTTRDHWGLVVSVSGAGDAAINAGQFTFDVGVDVGGAGGAVASDLLAFGFTDESVVTMNNARNVLQPLFIPGGSALSVRLSTDVAGAQSLDFVLTGLD